VKVVVLSRDLIVASRILAQASAAGHHAELVAEPPALPPAASVDLLFVNWADRLPSWADAVLAWRHAAPRPAAPRLVLYGPHTNLEAHAAARAAGLGPMWARSTLLRHLDQLLRSGANRS
jgi:hypothetical protein